jgi:putative FmdB family regulatory protein
MSKLNPSIMNLSAISNFSNGDSRQGTPSMPIFEYVCKGCGKQFEAIVLGSKEAECPQCSGRELEQQLSKFAAHSHSSSGSGSMPCGAPAGSCGNGGCGFN